VRPLPNSAGTPTSDLESAKTFLDALGHAQ